MLCLYDCFVEVSLASLSYCYFQSRSFPGKWRGQSVKLVLDLKRGLRLYSGTDRVSAYFWEHFKETGQQWKLFVYPELQSFYFIFFFQSLLWQYRFSFLRGSSDDGSRKIVLLFSQSPAGPFDRQVSHSVHNGLFT